MGNLELKPSVEKSNGTIKLITERDKDVHAFPPNISLKVNGIGFKFNDTIQQFYYYALQVLLEWDSLNILTTMVVCMIKHLQIKPNSALNNPWGTDLPLDATLYQCFYKY